MSLQKNTNKPNKIRFSGFSFDRNSQVLYSSAGPIGLQPKPAKVLAMLLRTPGELITREEIICEVWGDQIIDFDQNINFCIKQIRLSLDDQSKSPKFIETVPKKGYRFIGSIIFDNIIEPNVVNTKNSRIIRLIAGIGLFVCICLILWQLQPSFIHPKTKLIVDSSESAQIIERAFYLYDKGGKENYRLSQLLFEQVIKKHPESGVAYAGLALIKLFSSSDAQTRSLVRQHVKKALSLAPNSAQANLAKAKLSLYWDWNMKIARRYFERSVELDPDLIPALHDLAVVAVIQGDLAAAEISIQHVLLVAPGEFQEHYHAGWFYQAANQYNLALDQCEQSLEISPTHEYSILCAGRSALELELTQTASYYFSKYMKLAKVSPQKIEKIKSAIEKGDITPFNQWYADWVKEFYNDPFALSLAYAELGDIELALNSLQSAITDKHFMVPTAWAFNEFSSVRKHPRFTEMMISVKRF